MASRTKQKKIEMHLKRTPHERITWDAYAAHCTDHDPLSPKERAAAQDMARGRKKRKLLRRR